MAALDLTRGGVGRQRGMVAIQVMIIRASYKRVRSPNFLRKTNKLYFHGHLFLGSSNKVHNMLHRTGACWDRPRSAFLFFSRWAWDQGQQNPLNNPQIRFFWTILIEIFVYFWALFGTPGNVRPDFLQKPGKSPVITSATAYTLSSGDFASAGCSGACAHWCMSCMRRDTAVHCCGIFLLTVADPSTHPDTEGRASVLNLS